MNDETLQVNININNFYPPCLIILMPWNYTNICESLENATIKWFMHYLDMHWKDNHSVLNHSTYLCHLCTILSMCIHSIILTTSLIRHRESSQLTVLQWFHFNICCQFLSKVMLNFIICLALIQTNNLSKINYLNFKREKHNKNHKQQR